jgi:hypothetical protein
MYVLPISGFKDLEFCLRIAAITQIRINPAITLYCGASYALVWYG